MRGGQIEPCDRFCVAEGGGVTQNQSAVSQSTDQLSFSFSTAAHSFVSCWQAVVLHCTARSEVADHLAWLGAFLASREWPAIFDLVATMNRIATRQTDRRGFFIKRASVWATIRVGKNKNITQTTHLLRRVSSHECTIVCWYGNQRCKLEYIWLNSRWKPELYHNPSFGLQYCLPVCTIPSGRDFTVFKWNCVNSSQTRLSYWGNVFRYACSPNWRQYNDSAKRFNVDMIGRHTTCRQLPGQSTGLLQSVCLLTNANTLLTLLSSLYLICVLVKYG